MGYHDVYSIDDPELSFIPRPVHALIFTAPQKIFDRARGEELESMPSYDGHGPEEPVVWFRQTIGNTCGTMALLHGLSNGGAKEFVQPEGLLAQLLKKSLPLRPTERAEVLYDSQELEDAHTAAAHMGDTIAPTPESHVGNHYICFVKGDDGHLWELNGGMKGPIDRGVLADGEDMLSKQALELGVRSFVNFAEAGDVDFSMVAMSAAFN